MSFEEQLNAAVRESFLNTVRKADWLSIDYQNRVRVPIEDLRVIYSGLDMARVIESVRVKVESHISDSIMNSMATEIATDVKQILSNKELREDIRAIVREKLREFTREKS